MKASELEALVNQQAEQIDTLKTGMAWLREAHANLTDRIDRQTEGFTAKVEVMSAAIDKIIAQMGADDEDGPFYPEFKALKTVVEDMVPKVNSTNKSAPVKRNMTDADALRCLTGDAKDLAHKDAGEFLGLTYAQVYSCRLEFTFKHVHKDLRDAKWVNPWAK